MGRTRKPRNQCKPSMESDKKTNSLFIEYYKNQVGVIPEGEFDQFLAAIQSDLPSNFRVTGFKDQSRELGRLLKNQFLDSLLTHDLTIEQPVVKSSGDNEQSKQEDAVARETPTVIHPPKQLLWYPEGMAWQLDASRVLIRRCTELKRLHQFLVSESEAGFISRQEAVSMIPPLLLNVQSHHRILDMCAAPGSKTAQIVELLHSTAPEGQVPEGCVIANDVDSTRCYLMIHQVARLQSPAVVITRQDSTIYPRLYLPDSNSPTGESQLLMDRVLTDVPCSGDGTLRKNPDLWPRWSPNQGLNEHFLQTKILRRGLELLAVGGRLVYSTCSLNPIEDEAVVASMLAQCDNQVRILDVSGELPSLRYIPGLSTWRVMMKDGSWFDKFEDIPDKFHRHVRPSQFPPPDADKLGLEKCLRVLPHHQNTGGFFIAVLEKVGPLPWMKAARRVDKETGAQETESSSDVNGDNSDIPVSGETAPKLSVEEAASESVASAVSTDDQQQRPRGHMDPPPGKRRRIYREDPFYFVNDDDVEMKAMAEYYDLKPDFPMDQLMYRNAEGKRRNIYFTNQVVKQLVKTNAPRDVNFINLGVRVFGVSEDKRFSGYRLLHDGIDISSGSIGPRRRISLSCHDDLLTILKYDMPLATSLSEATAEKFKKLDVGPLVIEYIPPPTKEGEPQQLPGCCIRMAGWRGTHSLRHYVNRHERQHLLRLCGVEPEPIREAMVKTKDEESGTLKTSDNEDDDINANHSPSPRPPNGADSGTTVSTGD